MRLSTLLGCLVVAGSACSGPEDPGDQPHGPMAQGIYAALGEPAPYATAEQLETFARGKEVAERQFTRAQGLGPAFNVTFCAACHERPVTGGAAGLYRNFFLTGRLFPDGAFVPGKSAGKSGGVIRMYAYGGGLPSRPEVPAETNVIAQRNPIPFFGVGLIAELSGSEIVRRADTNDRDGDGISGRANYDQGFVGRFGRKSQTVSIEGFIRGPLFNHLGITTDPLTEQQRAKLPVDSSAAGSVHTAFWQALRAHAQAAAAAGPLTDDDDAPDPELSTQDLFDLVSYSMLLAAPPVQPETELTKPGRQVFDRLGCGGCHTPRINSKRGKLPVYSDLLLHDMGPELADGLQQGEATGAEFRTQPLWGIAAVGPYLHDGRAQTIEDAILMHGGEATASRDMAAELSSADMGDLITFLLSLGGADQKSGGLLPPGAPVPPVGTYGGPTVPLSATDEPRFVTGRALFDQDFGRKDGIGAPRFNGDSCRACHFEPVIGGAGPRGVNVMRHALVGSDGAFVAPAIGTVLHRETTLLHSANRPQANAAVFEHRQTPHLFGTGLIDGIAEATIRANADPNDKDGDGISGRVSDTDGGRIGRFGWKAQVPTLQEFVRDAVGTEFGMTMPWRAGQTFGILNDDDAVADPEFSLQQADDMLFYLKRLGPPPRTWAAGAIGPNAQQTAGENVFASLNCDRCHIPALAGDKGPVPLYSDLLLHEVLPPAAKGIEDAGAGAREFRTAPLWGLATSAPYLHSGAADTIDDAIRAHDGEAAKAASAYAQLSATNRAALLAFLGTL